MGKKITPSVVGKSQNLFPAFFSAFSENNLLSLAAAVSFYTALALAPIILIVLLVLSTFGQGFQNELIAQTKQLAGSQVAEAIQGIVSAAHANPEAKNTAKIFGAIILLVSASAVFVELQAAINKIFAVSEGESADTKWWESIFSLVRRRLLNAGMLLTFIFISSVSLVLSSTLAILLRSVVHTLAEIIVNGISFFLFVGVFTALYKWMPDRKVLWRQALKGSVITSLLFVVGKIGIGLYLGTAAVGSAYGASGSLIVLLVWVYYSTLIILSGAQITYLLELAPDNSHVR